jgi:hypothetical protein
MGSEKVVAGFGVIGVPTDHNLPSAPTDLFGQKGNE